MDFCMSPSDVFTKKKEDVVYDTTFNKKYSYSLKIVNTGSRRISWVIKTTAPNHWHVEPGFGVLDSSESTQVEVSCTLDADKSGKDQIMIEWTNTPEGTAKQFTIACFQGDCILRRKKLPVECDPKTASFFVYRVFLSSVP